VMAMAVKAPTFVSFEIFIGTNLRFLVMKQGGKPC
jgi:hypothetical protein